MSFIINQNFDLKSPQFNFARDYFEDLATLKAASEDNFPDHFITNVKGTLYQLTKSNSVDDKTGKWRELKFGLTSSEIDAKGYLTKTEAQSTYANIDEVNAAYDTSVKFKEFGGIKVSMYYTPIRGSEQTKDLPVASTTSAGVLTKNDFNAFSNKVDKVEGKGLSTNDYTTAEKTKLAGLDNYSLAVEPAAKMGDAEVIVLKKGDTAQNKITLSKVTPDVNVSGVITLGTPGLMSSSDKKKLDDIAEGANKTVIENTYNSKSTNAISGIGVASAVSSKLDASTFTTFKGDITSIEVCDNTVIDSIIDGTYYKESK